MSYELAESEEIQSGFVLASPEEQDIEGVEYSGKLEILLSDPEESLAGSLMVLGIIEFYQGMKKFLLIYPEGYFNED